jgi:hypothetical protein
VPLDLELIIDPPPCECCELAARCRANSEACEQFHSFVVFGGRRWRTEPREPSTEIYGKIFKGYGNESSQTDLHVL